MELFLVFCQFHIFLLHVFACTVSLVHRGNCRMIQFVVTIDQNPQVYSVVSTVWIPYTSSLFSIAWNPYACSVFSIVRYQYACSVFSIARNPQVCRVFIIAWNPQAFGAFNTVQDRQSFGILSTFQNLQTCSVYFVHCGFCKIVPVLLCVSDNGCIHGVGYDYRGFVLASDNVWGH